MSWTSVPCEAALETRAQQDTWAQLQQPEPDAGSGGGLSPKALRWPPGARFACLAKLLMSGNGYLSHLILLPGPATWALLLKEPERFLEYGLMQFTLINQ